MPQDQSIPSQTDAPTIETIDEVIRKTAQEGARQLLQQALVAEIQQHLEQHSDSRTEDDRQTVVRNGYAPERTIMTGVGPVNIQRPRVDERQAIARSPEHERYKSGVLPRFLRRTPTMEGVVATLYLKGLSTNDFVEAQLILRTPTPKPRYTMLQDFSLIPNHTMTNLHPCGCDRQLNLSKPFLSTVRIRMLNETMAKHRYTLVLKIRQAPN